VKSIWDLTNGSRAPIFAGDSLPMEWRMHETLAEAKRLTFYAMGNLFNYEQQISDMMMYEGVPPTSAYGRRIFAARRAVKLLCTCKGTAYVAPIFGSQKKVNLLCTALLHEIDALNDTLSFPAKLSPVKAEPASVPPPPPQTGSAGVDPKKKAFAAKWVELIQADWKATSDPMIAKALAKAKMLVAA
jgi:hypothetical protein